MTRIFVFLLLLLAVSCNDSPNNEAQADPATLTWEQVLEQARGTTVHLMMWQGDPLINNYMQQYVVPALKEQFGVSLAISAGQGNQMVQTLMTEMEAGKNTGELDLGWINGETFFQLRQIDALYGPWTDKLPNAQFIDFENPFINKDFQQPVAGYECPWGNVQMAIIYNSEMISEPPRTRKALADFVRAHPGKFTFDTQFTGLTFLKALLIDIAGGSNVLDGPFDEKKYAEASGQLWDYIREIKPYLWKQGQTFPDGVAQMHQMFANGELWFTMSHNDGEVDNKVLQGLFPNTARSYVPDFGTIQNSHYMGIPKLSGNKAGAMVVVNFLISPEARLKKQDPEVWGDGTVLDLDKLPAEWQQRFQNLPNRKYAPARAEMQKNAHKEPASEYMLRLEKDFRTQIIEK